MERLKGLKENTIKFIKFKKQRFALIGLISFGLLLPACGDQSPTTPTNSKNYVRVEVTNVLGDIRNTPTIKTINPQSGHYITPNVESILTSIQGAPTPK